LDFFDGSTATEEGHNKDDGTDNDDENGNMQRTSNGRLNHSSNGNQHNSQQLQNIKHT